MSFNPGPLFSSFRPVHLLLHPHGIAPTLKLDSCFFSYYIQQGNKSDKERKKISFMRTKRLNTFFKRWVQFPVYLLDHGNNRIDLGTKIFSSKFLILKVKFNTFYITYIKKTYMSYLIPIVK